MVHYCLFTLCLQTLSKRFNIKSFYGGEGVKLGASGVWDGGLGNFRCPLGRDCDLFVKMKADLCTSDEKGNTPFPKWKWTGGTKWANTPSSSEEMGKFSAASVGISQWWNETSRKRF